jgi:hypothetical protein
VSIPFMESALFCPPPLVLSRSSTIAGPLDASGPPSWLQGRGHPYSFGERRPCPSHRDQSPVLGGYTVLMCRGYSVPRDRGGWVGPF